MEPYLAVVDKGIIEGSRMSQGKDFSMKVVIDALRFYADPESWRAQGHPQIDADNTDIIHDRGAVAKIALKAIDAQREQEPE